MTGFDALVLAWLRSDCPEATTVTEVVPYGTDWAGDTESGFHDEFGVTIRYETPAGPRWAEISGERMESLWRAVVGGWKQ
jgi:hypothetical protein